jgi:hypothetical protein
LQTTGDDDADVKMGTFGQSLTHFSLAESGQA